MSFRGILIKTLNYRRQLLLSHCEKPGDEAISCLRSPRTPPLGGTRDDSSSIFLDLIVISVVAISLLPTNLLAQPEFFGYFESEADILQLGAKRYNFGYNKFRLDVEARPSDNVLIGANINVQQYWGKTTWNVFDFLPGFANSGLVYNIELQDTILVDNVYMRVSFPWVDLTFGKQQISPGVGYAWNPIDIFNSKSLLDPSYEQTGVKVLRFDLPLNDRSSLTAIVQPEADLDHTTQQYILKGGLGRFDFAVTTSYQARTDYFSPILGNVDITERLLLGGSLIGELLGWGIWSELGYNILDMNPVLIPEDSPSYGGDTEISEYVLGIDHTFDNSLYFLGEYLHNGFGVAEKSDLTMDDYFLALGGETHSLMQDYIFLYALHPTYDFVSLSAMLIVNLNDNSGTMAPQLDWNAFEDTNISLQGSLFWGDGDTEFGLQDWGLRLRLKSSF